jgi:hypothetical protein
MDTFLHTGLRAERGSVREHEQRRELDATSAGGRRDRR